MDNELSPYAQARVALAKLKIVQARYELLRYAREHRVSEQADASLADGSESIALKISEWSIRLSPDAPDLELIASALYITDTANNLAAMIQEVVHKVAPGF